MAMFADGFACRRADRGEQSAIEVNVRSSEEIVDGGSAGEGDYVDVVQLISVCGDRDGAIGNGQMYIGTAASHLVDEFVATLGGADHGHADTLLIGIKVRYQRGG